MKKEPKQDRTCTNNCSVVCGECQIFEPKQETLEESAKNYATNHGIMAYVFPEKQESFMDGAKWQQERSYSEEELFKIINDFCFDWNYNYKGELSQKEYLIEWFEKFKKK